MGTVIPVGFGQATWYGYHGSTGQTWANVLGFDHDGSAAVEDLAVALYASWESTILGEQSSSTALLGCRVKLGPGNLGPSSDFATLTAGSNDSASSPSNVAMLVRKQTAAGGRANRGRMFIVGVPEGEIGNPGTLAPADVTNWQGTFDDFQASVEGTPGITAIVILHDESSPVSTPTVVTSFSVQALVATQRRRLRR